MIAVVSLLLGNAGAAPSAQAPRCDGAWTDWRRFKLQYLSADGRVIDPSRTDARTVSEGQAYALFFALVANDRATFEQLLRWTENNLADGDLTQALPAWHWGRRADGSWGVIDANSASDADVWLVYTLDQAGRLWQQPYYRTLAAVIGARVFARETATLPELGLTLLPAPFGFQPQDDLWRLNPSYLPPMLLSALARHQPEHDWRALHDSALRLLVGSAPRGFAPDWVAYRGDHGFVVDEATAGVGSYDAIRVYLWLGLMSVKAQDRAALLRHFAPMAVLLRTRALPPASIDTASGVVSGDGPVGFSAALVPFLKASAEADAAARLQRQIQQQRGPQFSGYYDAVLSLFGLGAGQHYQFDAAGDLLPAWSRPC
ncbi:cellulase [Sinimarinibacterium sp. CAU 1509]|nr:cellulase [Sinimarinibacterium sp. CAU 1509]